MIFGTDRSQLRRMYHDAWRKSLDGRPLSPLETQIVDVIVLHPEYHVTLEAADLERDFLPEDNAPNPYLHMGLHLGLREQLATDRPAGIKGVYDKLCRKVRDRHDVEHRMIECLAETLWEAQRNNAAPDELMYLERLRRL